MMLFSCLVERSIYGVYKYERSIFGIGGVGYSVGASFLSYLLFKGFYGGADERIHCLDSLCRIHKAD